MSMGKIDFQDGHHGGHLGFPIGTIFATFDLQVTPKLPCNPGTSQLAFLFRRSEKQIFNIATMVAILNFRLERFYFAFDLQVTLMLPTKI